jgi:DNA adenine methylase
MDWATCIRRYDRPHTLFYCDPPYWGTEGYGVDFGLENYDLMAALARSIQGQMIISVNDIPEMRQAFKGLQMQSVGITYNLQTVGKPIPKRELIICNFD